MRSAFATFATAVLIVAGSSGIALAKGATHEFSGNITHLNATAKTLAVKETVKPNAVMSFTLAPGAKIRSNAMNTSLDKLAVGQRVVVKYTDEGAKHTAAQIDAHARIASAKPKSKPVVEN